MGIILDLILVAIIVFFIWRSAKRGFVRVVVELVGYLLVLYIAFVCSAPLATVCYDTFAAPSVTNSIETAIKGAVGNSANAAADDVIDSIPDFISESASRFGFSTNGLKSTLQSSLNQGTEKAAVAVADYVARPIITGFIRSLLVILIFLIGFFLVRLLARAINTAFKLPIIGTANRFLGGGIGLLKGFVFAFLFCIIISALVSVTKNGFLIFTKENIDSSNLFSFLSGFNPIDK